MPIRIDKDIRWDVLREKTEQQESLRGDVVFLRAELPRDLGGEQFIEVAPEDGKIYQAAKRLQQSGLL